MSHTTTDTYAMLEISDEAYAEIRGKLSAAGYSHAFHYRLDANDKQSEWINMTGLAVRPSSGGLIDETGCAAGGGHIELLNGKLFSIRDPQPDQIEIEHIAHALAAVNRFGGHSIAPYSVATHSRLCAEVAASEGHTSDVVLAVLLHDASEAYLGDVVRPLKNMLPGYREIEERVQSAIWRRFGVAIDPAVKAVIKRIDNAVLRAEAEMLMVSKGENWGWGDCAAAECYIWPEPHRKAKDGFMLMFHEHYKSAQMQAQSGEHK